MSLLLNFRENKKNLNWKIIWLSLILFFLFHFLDAVLTYHIVCNLGGTELMMNAIKTAYAFGYMPMVLITTISPLILFFGTLLLMMLLTQDKKAIYLVMVGAFAVATFAIVLYEGGIILGYHLGRFQWEEYWYLDRKLFCRLF